MRHLLIVILLLLVSLGTADIVVTPAGGSGGDVSASDSLSVFATPKQLADSTSAMRTELADSTSALRTDLAGGGGGSTTYDEYYILDAAQGHTDLDSALTAIQSAATSPVVELLPGTYTLSANTTIEDIAIIGKHSLYNTGAYKVGFGTAGAIIELDGAYFTCRDNVVVKNVMVTVASSSIFTGFYLSQSGTAIDNVTFDNVVFNDITHQNTNAAPRWIDCTENASIVIRNCGFYGTVGSEKWAGFLDADNYNIDGLIENNYFLGMEEGFKGSAGTSGSNVTIIKGNIFEDCDYGIYFTDGQGGTYHILDNHFISCNTYDIRYSSSASSMTVYDKGNGDYSLSGELDDMTAYDTPSTFIHGTLYKSNGTNSTTTISSSSTWYAVDCWSTVGENYHVEYDGTLKGLSPQVDGFYRISFNLSAINTDASGAETFVFQAGFETARIDSGNCRLELVGGEGYRTLAFETYATVPADSTVRLWVNNITGTDNVGINGGSFSLTRVRSK